jgi:hypothetical protein
LHSRIHSRLSTSILYRTTADIARKHSRASLIAASAAAAGVLGAAGFAVGAAPWARSPSTSGQPGTLFAAITGMSAHDGKALIGGQHDTARSAETARSADATALPGHAPAEHQAAEASAGTAAVAGSATVAHTAVVARIAAAERHFAQQAGKQQAPEYQAATHQAAKPKAHAAPARPYLIYDSVTPGSIPSGRAAAVYVNGAYAVSSAQVAGHRSVLWIDTNGSDPAANVLDVEPGDATPACAAQWARQRLSSQPYSVAIVYTMKSDWQQVKDNIATLPGWMRSKVRYWIADPTGVPHVVAGASATQWYWGNSYDITTANPGFIG